MVQSMIYVATALISVMITTGLAVSTYRYKTVPGTIYFSILLGLVSFWSLLSALIAIPTTPVLQSFARLLTFIPISFLPVLWILFVFDYTKGWKFFNRRLLIFMLIIPGFTLVLAATQPWLHLLVRNEITGWWLYVQLAYSCTLLLLGTILLISNATLSSRIYQAQVVCLVVGAAIPIGASIIAAVNPLSIEIQNFVPISFAIFALVIIWGIQSYRLFELIPAAREVVMDSLVDSIFILDTNNNVLEMNPAAEQWVQNNPKSALHRPVDQVLPFWKNLPFAQETPQDYQGIIQTDQDEHPGVYEIRVVSLGKDQQGKPSDRSGRFVMLRDASAIQALNASDQQHIHELEALHATLLDLTSELDLPVLLSTAVDRIAGILEVPFTYVSIYNRLSDDLEVVVSKTPDKSYTGTHIKLGEGGSGKAALERKTVIVENYAEWETHMDMVQFPYAVSLLFVPLLHRDELEGVITVAIDQQKRTFSQHDIHLLELFAHQLATAIHNALKYGDIQRQATTDPITGLSNRWNFMRSAQVEFDRGRRFHTPLSVILFDIDHFKSFNDAYGHSTGDIILKTMSDVCKNDFRTYDMIGRYGGDEFAILLPETNLDNAVTAAERLRANIASMNTPTGTRGFRTTISLGVSTLLFSDLSLEMFIERADKAMYRAKATGRNRVCF
jgi:diguanylate cyclase (GGDEF)-like protein